jgi:uncharacterized protein
VSGIYDVDVHPKVPSLSALDPYLSARWREHARRYGTRTHNGLAFSPEYPGFAGKAMRADAWPDSGNLPGTDLGLMRRQLLDVYGIEFALLQCLETAAHQLNQEYGAAIARALTDWQLEHWARTDPRLHVCAPVTYETPELAVPEIERVSVLPGVAAILLMSKSIEPLGRRRYWPIYACAQDLGLPIVVHLSQGGGHPNTSTGWSSYHTEYHVAHTQTFESQILSLLCEGTFERFPRLRFVMVEGGVAFLPPLARRLDFHWRTLRDEVPGLRMPPSEYIAEHIWVSTQPVDEPENPRHLVELFRDVGIGQILFATDYPHFDFDSPTEALPGALTAGERQKIMRENARSLFGHRVRAA